MLTIDSLDLLIRQVLVWMIDNVQFLYWCDFKQHSGGMRQKGDGSYVGNLDRMIATSFRERLGDHCQVVTEEDETVAWPPTANGFTMLVDPLDGTHNHAMGFLSYGTMILIAKDCQPFAAFILLPVQERIANNGLYIAIRNQGAYRFNSWIGSFTSIKVSSETDLAKGIVLLEGPSDKQEASAELTRLAEKSKHKRTNISMAWAGALVASGASYPIQAQALIAIDNHPWDNLPPCLLIEEAGGRVTDFKGNPWTLTTRNIVAANPNLHATILAVMQNPEGVEQPDNG